MLRDSIKMKNYSILIISAYKLLGALTSILMGMLILYFGSIISLVNSVFKKEILEDPNDLFYSFLLGHINQSSKLLALILAFSLIIFSVLEITFVAGLLLRKKWGAIGLFIISVLWVPVEILFISKFLLGPRIIGVILDIIILILLFQMIMHSRKYFRD